MKPATNIKLTIIDLDEIPDNIDISVNLPKKEATEPIKRPLNPKSVQLF